MFIQDALSPEQKGAEARAELLEKLSDFGWSVEDVEARYGPIFAAAIWVEPVEEGSGTISGRSRTIVTTRCSSALRRPCT